MVPTIQYAASNGVWKNYPCEVPSGTTSKAVYRAVEGLMSYRPGFRFRVIWP